MESTSLMYINRIGKYLRIRRILRDRADDASTSSINDLNIPTSATDLNSIPRLLIGGDIPSPATTAVYKLAFGAELR